MHTDHIFSINSSQEFEALALEAFYFQYKNVTPYRRYCELIGVKTNDVTEVEDIPFLPIQFFKSEKIIVSELTSETVFESSGTTGAITSKHHVADLHLYQESFLRAFNQFYGQPEEWVILALLPSYLERKGSSLVFMVDRLINTTGNPNSGFYLNDLDTLGEKLLELEEAEKKVLLLGVSYALLDLIEARNFRLKYATVMETGGMKGKRKEMIKEELHQVLKEGYGVGEIHSEYGMTELLSQAYSKGGGRFNCPPWMKVITRDPEDPLTMVSGKTGGINVIDLANWYSCSFIATEDLGKCHPDGSFEILGRFDTSDIRGCNLMVL